MDPLSTGLALIGIATITYVVQRGAHIVYWWGLYRTLPPTSQTYKIDILNKEVETLKQSLDSEISRHQASIAIAKIREADLKADYDELTDGILKRLGE